MSKDKQFDRRKFLKYSAAAAAGSTKIFRSNSKSAYKNGDEKMEHKYLNYLNHRVYYETRGDSQKTLVFIHGWTSSIESWKYQLDYFPDYKVIAIDLPGNGKSSKDENLEYTM